MAWSVLGDTHVTLHDIVHFDVFLINHHICLARCFYGRQGSFFFGFLNPRIFGSFILVVPFRVQV